MQPKPALAETVKNLLSNFDVVHALSLYGTQEPAVLGHFDGRQLKRSHHQADMFIRHMGHARNPTQPLRHLG